MSVTDEGRTEILVSNIGYLEIVSGEKNLFQREIYSFVDGFMACIDSQPFRQVSLCENSKFVGKVYFLVFRFNSLSAPPLSICVCPLLHFIVYSSVYTKQRTVYFSQCTVYSVHCILYTVQCAICPPLLQQCQGPNKQ